MAEHVALQAAQAEVERLSQQVAGLESTNAGIQQAAAAAQAQADETVRELRDSKSTEGKQLMVALSELGAVKRELYALQTDSGATIQRLSSQVSVQ